MNEKLIEKKLREAVKRKGGLALKFVSPGFNGVPDRLILLPGGKVKFVEAKSDGKKPKDRQLVVIELLREMGFEVAVLNDAETLKRFIDEI